MPQQFILRSRVLLVSAPRADDTRLIAQLGEVAAHRAGMDERDVVLRVSVGIGDAFAVLLIGKDRGEKLRSADPVAAKDLFALIDSMPMRQQEYRAR